jgi:hypothetical protein
MPVLEKRSPMRRFVNSLRKFRQLEAIPVKQKADSATAGAISRNKRIRGTGIHTGD